MKYLWRSIIGVIIIVFVGAALCYTVLPSIVSYALSKRAEVKVSVAGITLSSSDIKIKNLYIGNPSHSILPKALQVEEINVDVPINHFFKKKIVIPNLELDDLYIGLEFNSKKDHNGNWTFIMKNLSDSDSNASKKSDTEVVIKKLKLTNLEVAIVYKTEPKKIQKIKIPSLEFSDVSSKGGIPSAQITQLVMRQALKRIFSKEGLQNMLKDVANPNEEGFFESFKSLFSFDLQQEDIQL